MELIYRRPAPISLPPSHGRSLDRLHLTEVLHHIETKLGMWAKYSTDFESREGMLKTSLGLAWEEWFAEHIYTQPPINGVYHFGEIELDGIVGTPDGLSTVWCDRCQADVEAVDEFKTSRFSMKQWDDIAKVFEAPEWWHRLSQTKSYCAMLGARHARFWIYHVCGNYKHGADRISCEKEEFLVEFTEEEVEQTWAMVLNHAPQVEREQSED